MIKYFEQFFRIQIILGFIFLVYFLVYRRSHLVGILGFSDHTLNYLTETTLEEEEIKKGEKEVINAPSINGSRVGYFVPIETGVM